MSESELEQISSDLRARGLERDARVLEEIRHDIEEIERPPGVLRRITSAIRDRAAHHWRLAVDEMRESREAWALLRRRIQQGEELSPEQRDAVRAQVMDALRTVPAGVLTAATAVTPFPGAMLLTPWVLQRLGLLPSRWREQAVLDRLHEESEHLREVGEVAASERLDELCAQREVQALRLSQMAERTALRTHWDLDGDGTISDAERAAYDDEVARLAALVPSVGPQRRWYLQVCGNVLGPVRWGEALDADPALPVFVCLDGESGWVELSDVQTRAGWRPE